MMVKERNLPFAPSIECGLLGRYGLSGHFPQNVQHRSLRHSHHFLPFLNSWLLTTFIFLSCSAYLFRLPHNCDLSLQRDLPGWSSCDCDCVHSLEVSPVACGVCRYLERPQTLEIFQKGLNLSLFCGYSS
jgi:hypothetical protein